MARVRHRRHYALDAFGVGSFLQKTAQIGNIATVRVRSRDIVGAKSIHRNQYEEQPSFLLPRRSRGQQARDRKQEHMKNRAAKNPTRKTALVHGEGKDTSSARHDLTKA